MTDTLEPRRIVVATAGHVDHGKTSLIRALTGIDTDRLPEEKRRGISIELGFAEFAAGAISFIDVPGHERLVHTMIAGVGGVDALLLVVAADDGVMPQTREHLAVCSVLGVGRVVVALSKCDLADAETLDLAEAEIREELARFGWEPLAIVRTSNQTGEGLAELERSLRALAADVPPRAPSARAWLSVDRLFSLRGVGTVVTGTLTRGGLREGDVVYLATEAGVLETACRSLQVHGRRVTEATAPSRVAINLARLSLDAISRGDVITKDPELIVSRRFDMSVRWLPGMGPPPAGKATLVAHLGTTRAAARVRRLDDETAHVVLDRALPCEGGVGVVLRGDAARREFGRVMGGGRVLDARALPLPRRRDARAWELRGVALNALARGDVGAGLVGLLRFRAPRPIAEADVERRLGLEPGSVAAVFASPRYRDLAVALRDGQSWTTREGVDQLLDAGVAWLRRFHEESPLELGAPIETLRTVLGGIAGREAGSYALEQAMASRRMRAVDPGLVCLPEFAENAAQSHDQAVKRVREALEIFALEGATEQEIAERTSLPLERTRTALSGLARQDEARRLSGLWFGERPLAGLRAAVRVYLSGHSIMSVPTFKQLFGVSRKQAIPLLEDLDHRGVTRRQGDERVLGPATE